MRDSDKPFLTFQKTFYNFDGYVFPYDYSDVDIKALFQRFFAYWEEEKANPLLTSEIRCLSCRMAMYAKTFEIAKSNNFKIIAEGVETKEQCDMLLRLGCYDGQGYYFSKPIPAEEFQEKYFC